MKRKINIALKCIFFTITVGVILYATTIVLERKDSLYKYADFFELAKKDQIKEKQIKAAEVLYNQITTIENNNYNRNSIEKLKRDIHSNELYISKDLCNDMISLADQFLEQKDGTGTINIELNESVKLQLKELYGQ